MSADPATAALALLLPPAAPAASAAMLLLAPDGTAPSLPAACTADFLAFCRAFLAAFA